jgi:hypothetical protein
MEKDDDVFAAKVQAAVGLSSFTCISCGYEVLVDAARHVYPSSHRIIQQALRAKGRAIFLEDDE